MVSSVIDWSGATIINGSQIFYSPPTSTIIDMFYECKQTQSYASRMVFGHGYLAAITGSGRVFRRKCCSEISVAAHNEMNNFSNIK